MYSVKKLTDIYFLKAYRCIPGHSL